MEEDVMFLNNDRTFKYILRGVRNDYNTAVKELNTYLYILNLHRYIGLWRIKLNQTEPTKWELING